MTIHLDDPEERDALLEPQIESLKSVDERDAAAARRPLGRRLSIGGPVFRPVTPHDAGDDEQLHRFIESERGASTITSAS